MKRKPTHDWWPNALPPTLDPYATPEQREYFTTVGKTSIHTRRIVYAAKEDYDFGRTLDMPTWDRLDKPAKLKYFAFAEGTIFEGDRRLAREMAKGAKEASEWDDMHVNSIARDMYLKRARTCLDAEFLAEEQKRGAFNR